MNSPDRFLTLPDLGKEYAVLADWFEDPTHQTAQMQGENRLMSAEEKMQLLGGENIIKQTLDSLSKQWKNRYLILQACIGDAMTGQEIVRFVSKLGVKMDTAGANLTAVSLFPPGQLKSISGLVYITRQPVKTDSLEEKFKVSEVKQGYQTTEVGLSAITRGVATGGSIFSRMAPPRSFGRNLG